MYLKRIEIAGFKSFADRTVIEFDQGLTAVVGPNGSGKSNITEAIRWVLGEQSAKNLRGGKMPDIIFAGSANRKAQNVAEVTVVLDNEERFLPLDYTEVSVTRKLKRSGESDFYINKQNCRLKDIIDLFMDSGLGKESFSIISQGKVEAIFNSKPEDRRGIFEEAAGVLKYKQRKHQAEQKLFETEDNLNRVKDIIYELEVQLEPLKEQAEIAKKYLAIKHELTAIDVGVTVSEISEFKMTWEVAKEDYQEYQKQLKDINLKLSNLNGLVTKLKEERNAIEQELNVQQEQLVITTQELEQAEGQRKVLLERVTNIEKTSEEYQTNLVQEQSQASKLQAELKELEQAYANKEDELADAQEKLGELQQEVDRYSKSTKEILEELRNEYFEVMQQQANCGNDLKHLEKEYQQETARNATSMDKKMQVDQQVKELQAKLKEIEIACSNSSDVISDLRQKYSKTQAEYRFNLQQLQTKRQEWQTAQHQLHAMQARQKSLQDLQDNYSGFYQGVRAILTNKKQVKGVIGAVAELIEVPSSYALALETALGAASQHVVVKDEASGRKGITFLKEKRLGRATFLPLTTIKPRKLPDKQVLELQDLKGFVGIANELVTYDTKVQPIIDNLLGTTIIATDLTAANLIARQVFFKYKVVSLEGDVMNPGGSMTGGAIKKGSQGLFAQAAELEDLKVQLQKLDNEQNKLQRSFNELQASDDKLSQQLEEFRVNGEEARLNEQQLLNQQSLISERLTQAKREQQTFEIEHRELDKFLTNYEHNKRELEEQLKTATEEQARLDNEMAELSATEASNLIKKEAYTQELNQQQALVAVIEEQLSHILANNQDKLVQWQEVNRKVRHLEEQLQFMVGNSSSQSISQETLAYKLEQLSAKKEEVAALIAILQKRQQEVVSQLTDNEEQVRGYSGEQAQLMEQSQTVELLKNRIELQLDAALKHLTEDYGLSYELAKQKYSIPTDLIASKSLVKEHKQAIEDLGPINMSAIEQHEQINERYQFITEQRDDLLLAKDKLFGTMGEMDAIVEKKFAEMFHSIASEFSNVFPKMFGGGYAKLTLTNPEDLLTTGIEIEAQPPGKKLQSLSLLSGGERALTAIALLFAVIQVRPVPFCVLDEVEAALDEANVVRFGRYLSSFDKEIQFIVITHRKGTMEAADVLYGVTMAENGVSKIVSVKMEEVATDGSIKGT